MRTLNGRLTLIGRTPATRLVRLTDRAQQAIPIAESAVAQVTAEWQAHFGRRRMEPLRRTSPRYEPRTLRRPLIPTAAITYGDQHADHPASPDARIVIGPST